MNPLTPARRKATAAFRYLSLASFITAAASTRTLSLDQRNSTQVLGERFPDFLARVTAEKDTAKQRAMAGDFADRLRTYGRAVIEDTTVYLIYYGKARTVSVPSDLNGWRPGADTMRRVGRTPLFYLPLNVERAARFEYKFVVDSVWLLDPMNRQQAIGGYGPNSEIWMPDYRPPREIEFRSEIRHGKLDTLAVRSRLLKRNHPVFVYLPPGYPKGRTRYPTLYVTDGGEYITLALMVNILDNLIADKRILPVVAVFVDPRTDMRDSQTSKRIFDYSMSDTFVNFLADELRALMMKRYRLDPRPAHTGIMGASLGALLSTYAAYTRPDVFGLFAAQSPAYWWKNGAMIKLVQSGPKKPIKGYIGTGTLRDAHAESEKMKAVLAEKGYQVRYSEYPEGHNWVQWRAYIDEILEYFWGTAR